MGLYQVLCIFVRTVSLVFLGFLTVGASVSLTPLSALETLFLMVGCLAKPQRDNHCLLLYFVFVIVGCFSWRPVFFL